jgi:hypothetical protein
MFEAFAVVEIHIVIFWVMTAYSLVGGYENIGGTFYPHLHETSDTLNHCG